jgi:hypothetical protein
VNLRLPRALLVLVVVGSAACAGVLGIDSVGYAPDGDGGVEASYDGAPGSDGSTPDTSQADGVAPDAPAVDATYDVAVSDLCPDLDASAYLDVADALPVPGSAFCDDSGGSSDLSSDWKNCGACGHVCPNHSCGAGTCTPDILQKPAPSLAAITVFAVQGDRVYWSRAEDGGTIGASAVDGGAPIPVTVGASPSVKSAALLGATVYLAANGGLYSVPAGGGTPAPLAQTVPKDVSELTATKTTLFWLDHAVPTAGWVGVTDGRGGTLSTPPGGPTDLVGDETAAFWVQGTNLLTADDATRSQLGYTQTFSPDTVAIDAFYAYLYQPLTHEVVRLPRSKLNADPVSVGRLPRLPAAVTRMATDDKNVYAIAGRVNSSTAFSLIEVPKCGGPPLVLVTSADITEGIVATGGYVYFATLGGQILRVPR